MADEKAKETPEVATRNNKTAVQNAGAGKAPEKAKETVEPPKQATLQECIAKRNEVMAAQRAEKELEAKIEAEVRKRMLAEMKK